MAPCDDEPEFLPAVLARQAGDAAFLWRQRARVLALPHTRLFDLLAFDERLGAQLDGLSVAGASATAFVEAAAAQGEAGGALFTTAVLALESGRREAVSAAFAGAGSGPLRRQALEDALAWVSWRRAEPWARPLLEQPQADWRRLGLAAHARHRADPGPALAAALAAEDLTLAAAAARAAGELGRTDLCPQLLGRLTHAEPALRAWAAWSAVRLGAPEALPALAGAIRPGSGFAASALALLVRALEPRQAVDWLRSLNGQPGWMRVLIRGGAHLGDPQMIPWLLARAAEPPYARLAAESIAWITGLDLEPAGLSDPPPQQEPEAAADEIQLDTDSHLPWPDVAALSAWWQSNGRRFQAGRRYLCGRPLDAETCRFALRSARQRERAGAALELALAQPTAPLFDVATLAARQRAGIDAGP